MSTANKLCNAVKIACILSLVHYIGSMVMCWATIVNHLYVAASFGSWVSLFVVSLLVMYIEEMDG